MSIYDTGHELVDELKKLNLPAGVEISINV